MPSPHEPTTKAVEAQVLPPAKQTQKTALTLRARIENVIATLENAKAIVAERGIHHWEIIPDPLNDAEFKDFTKRGVKKAMANAQSNWQAMMGDAPLMGAKLIKCGRDKKRHMTAGVLIAVLADDVYVVGRVQAIKKASKEALDEIRPQLGLALRRAGARAIVVLAEEEAHDDSLYLEGYRFERLPIELDEPLLEIMDGVIEVFGFASSLGADPEEAPVFISRNARPGRAKKADLTLDRAEFGGEIEGGVQGLGRVKLHGGASFKKP